MGSSYIQSGARGAETSKENQEVPDRSGEMRGMCRQEMTTGNDSVPVKGNDQWGKELISVPLS